MTAPEPRPRAADAPAFTFRPLSRADFPMLGGWLREPHVDRWWANDSSPEALERDYGGTVDGTEPSDVFVVLAGGRPVGLAQRYRIEAYPTYVREIETVLPLPAHAASIDYLIGPPDALGRGLGAEMVRRLTETVWRDMPDVRAVLVPVHAENAASWRALERAGYRRVGRGDLDPDNPADSRDHVFYQVDRPTAP